MRLRNSQPLEKMAAALIKFVIEILFRVETNHGVGMVQYRAYGIKWGDLLPLQGWVVKLTATEGIDVQLVQTIRTARTEEELKFELGVDQTDKDWQIQASKAGAWELQWEGMVPTAHPFYEGGIKELIGDALLIDPHLGMPVNRYWNADEYRAALPELAWKFNPWTGKYRNPEDINNDPLGLLIGRSS